MKAFVAVLMGLLLVAAGAWYQAGRMKGPVLELVQPTHAIGQDSDLIATISTPDRKLSKLEVILEQGGAHALIYHLPGGDSSALMPDGENRLRLTRPIGKRHTPELTPGTARLRVSASRPVLWGLREVSSTLSRDVQVQLAPPVISVLSSFHYINLGGSELVVYRVTPADASSGVRVGEHEYPGFPARGADIEKADPGLRVAFFALLWNQDAKTPIRLYARDALGNEGSAQFDYRVFRKIFRKSQIDLKDEFLQKVVPSILENSPDFSVANPSDLLTSFLRINGGLRQRNNAQLADLARHTAPEMLWHGPFRQLLNTAVEGSFADQRTYFYQGREVDRQVHLGFDLASTANTPVLAANSGTVVHAAWLGIYGNCVVVDHGMGLQSLYAHLSSISVKKGDPVKMGDALGRSGSTGLAGGDHLHFTMLLGGNAVSPVDWWSGKWIQDRITRKLRDASQAAAFAGQTP